MPWTENDVSKHNKNLSSASKTRWARIANSILAKTNDEGLAVRIANSRVKPSNKEVIRKKLYG